MILFNHFPKGPAAPATLRITRPPLYLWLQAGGFDCVFELLQAVCDECLEQASSGSVNVKCRRRRDVVLLAHRRFTVADIDALQHHILTRKSQLSEPRIQPPANRAPIRIKLKDGHAACGEMAGQFNLFAPRNHFRLIVDRRRLHSAFPTRFATEGREGNASGETVRRDQLPAVDVLINGKLELEEVGNATFGFEIDGRQQIKPLSPGIADDLALIEIVAAFYAVNAHAQLRAAQERRERPRRFERTAQARAALQFVAELEAVTIFSA